MANSLSVHKAGTPLRWRVLIDGEEAGDLRVIVRPDARCFASFESCRSGVEQALLAAVDEEIGVVLHVNVAENDETALRLFEQLGFVIDRRESSYAVPTDPATTGLEIAAIPGIALVQADRVDERRLRELDDALRQDVPGTGGWRWDEAAFREETFDPAYFDPTMYLVAVELGRGEYVGIARVWNNPRAPRLGLIAVLPAHRQRGLARALLANVFAVLHSRGLYDVSAEVDDANIASTALLTSLGARRTGGTVELRRAAPGAQMARHASARG